MQNFILQKKIEILQKEIGPNVEDYWCFCLEHLPTFQLLVDKITLFIEAETKAHRIIGGINIVESIWSDGYTVDFWKGEYYTVDYTGIRNIIKEVKEKLNYVVTEDHNHYSEQDEIGEELIIKMAFQEAMKHHHIEEYKKEITYIVEHLPTLRGMLSERQIILDQEEDEAKKREIEKVRKEKTERNTWLDNECATMKESKWYNDYIKEYPHHAEDLNARNTTTAPKGPPD